MLCNRGIYHKGWTAVTRHGNLPWVVVGAQPSLSDDVREAERANPDLAGRPAVVRGSTQLLFPGMRRLSENTVINTKNKSHSVTAELEIRSSGAKGVIAAHGGHMGGWSLYVHDGALKYHYNFVGLLHFDVTAGST